MDVYGASFDSASLHSRRGRLVSVDTFKGFFSTKTSIPAADILSVTIITTENKQSIMGMFPAAVIGTILAGPAGMIIGGLTGGKWSRHLVALKFKTNQSFIANVSPEELRLLAAAVAEHGEVDYLPEPLPEDETVSARPVIKRLSYADRLAASEANVIPVRESRTLTSDQELSPSKKYETLLRAKLKLLDVLEEDIEEAKEFRKELKLTPKQTACVHAKLFASSIKRFTETDELNADDAACLRSLKQILRQLGWAPGD